MLTHWTDIFAFAIVCIEVLSMGELPWGTMNDEDVRSALLGTISFVTSKDQSWTSFNRLE